MTSIADSLRLALQLIASADAQLLRIVALSLQVSGTACLLGAVFGLWLGAWLAVARFPGQRLLVWLVNTLLALPAVVVGLVVYLLLSRSGPLGTWGILFTPAAMVAAQTLLVVPLIAALARRLVLDALDEGGDQLQSLGAGPLATAALLLLHARFGVLTVLLTAFGRAVAEVGAVMIVGGNIDGVTRVMTTAIALETSKGDLPLALALGLVLLAVVGAVNALVALAQWRGGGARAAARGDAVAGVAALGGLAGNAGVPGADGSLSAPPLPRQHPPPQTLLTLRGASVRFGPIPALSDVSLQLRRGERLLLVGANGSGKSTLLRLLQGLLPCDSGICERHTLRPEGRLPVAAMLFQRPFLLHLSVRRNVLLALWLRKVPAGQRAGRCLQALQQVGLAALAERPARTLSGGQQQRLALARACALAPDLLLLDEPTASLDPGAKREIEALIDSVCACGITLVMSTHNLGQAKRMADRVACFEHGRLLALLPTANFFNDELPPAAALFVKGELPWT